MNIISLNKEDKIYTNFESFEISKSLENTCGNFKFDASISDIETFPFKVGQSVQVAIDGESFITGFIDSMNPQASRENHIISIAGRDKIADLLDSQIEAKAIKAPIGMVDLIATICKLVGYKVVNERKFNTGKNSENEISIINNYGNIEVFQERIDLRSGESGWNLIQKYAEKRQLIITSNGEGNIVINKIGMNKASTILKNVENEENNNLKDSNYSIDTTNRFYKYVVKSNNTNAPESDDDGYQVGAAYDPSIRKTRVLLISAPIQSNSADCKKRAEWEANVRKVNSIKYSVTLTGFRQNLNEKNNPLWDINQLVYVKDQDAGIDDEVLIKSVTFSKTKDSGSITKLELVDKLAYTLSLNEPELRKGKQVTGSRLFDDLGQE